MALKTKMLSLVLVCHVVLISVSARADAVCNSLPECEQLINAAEERLRELQRETTLGPVARGEDGAAFLMTHRDAVSYCATHGGLPSAKHLALAQNPSGVSERPRDGFYKVAPWSSVPFYYYSPSYGGRPLFEEKGYWTASLIDSGRAYVFLRNGDIHFDSRSNLYAVRCIDR